MADDRHGNIEFCVRPTTNAVMYQTYYFRLDSAPGMPGGWERAVTASATVVPVTVKGPGDVNGDGAVNAADLSEVVSNFGKTY